MLKIRDIEISSPLVLAPIAGYTDTLFRQAIKGLGGCGLVVSELVSTEGMTRRMNRSISLTRFDEIERPIAIQIFGADPRRMAESAAIVQDTGADILDVNVGCPVRKVVKQGGGSNLLRDLPLLKRIFEAVRKAVAIPLTVKVRSGWDRKSINALEVLKLAEDCGVEGLTIHGRARCDMFISPADWSVIAEVKANARIPIVGNGDVFTPADAERMFRETGVDGIMIGRGILRDPWLIHQCWDHLNGRPVCSVSLEEKEAFMSRLLRRIYKEVPEPVSLGKMKKMGSCLSKGIPGGGELRSRLHACRTGEEFLQTLSMSLARHAPGQQTELNDEDLSKLHEQHGSPAG